METFGIGCFGRGFDPLRFHLFRFFFINFFKFFLFLFLGLFVWEFSLFTGLIVSDKSVQTLYCFCPVVGFFVFCFFIVARELNNKRKLLELQKVKRKSQFQETSRTTFFCFARFAKQ